VPCVLRRFLRVDVISGLSTETTEEEHAGQGNYPGIALVDMHHVVPNKTRDEGAHTNDDNSNDGRKGTRVDVRQCLTAENDGRCGEAKPRQGSVNMENMSEKNALREDVEDRVDSTTEISRAETGDDHGAETRYGAEGSNKRCRDGPESAEAENSSYRIPRENKCGRDTIHAPVTYLKLKVKVDCASTPTGMISNTVLTDLHKGQVTVRITIRWRRLTTTLECYTRFRSGIRVEFGYVLIPGIF
jgi:hypothetical protein